MNEEQKNLIHEDMTIGSLMDIFPKQGPLLAQAMQEYGLHCVGCHANTFETLRQGVLGHGFSENDLKDLLDQLNAIVAPLGQEEKSESKAFTLYVTDAAIARIKEMLSKESDPEQGLRLSVLPGGCAGASYDMKFQKSPETGDLVIAQGGITLFVDADARDLLNGLQIDFKSSLLESSFKFINPNATGSCGCGTSFSYE